MVNTIRQISAPQPVALMIYDWAPIVTVQIDCFAFPTIYLYDYKIPDKAKTLTALLKS